jgi:addiction module RelE/StbE family toxin
MKIFWSNEAFNELSEIISYIAKDNPIAADNLAQHIYTEIESLLTEHPRTGRIGRVKDTFELVVHKSYIAIYFITLNQITILSIRHTARLWPRKF